MSSRKEEKFNFHVHNNINKLGRTRKCGTLGIAGFGADKSDYFSQIAWTRLDLNYKLDDLQHFDRRCLPLSHRVIGMHFSCPNNDYL